MRFETYEVAPQVPGHGFDNPRHTSTVKNVCHCVTGRHVIWCRDTFFSGDVLSDSRQNNGFGHVISGSELRVEHIATQNPGHPSF